MSTRLLPIPLLIITKAWRQIKHALYINNLWKDYYTVVKKNEDAFYSARKRALGYFFSEKGKIQNHVFITLLLCEKVRKGENIFCLLILYHDAGRRGDNQNI